MSDGRQVEERSEDARKTENGHLDGRCSDFACIARQPLFPSQSPIRSFCAGKQLWNDRGRSLRLSVEGFLEASGRARKKGGTGGEKTSHSGKIQEMNALSEECDVLSRPSISVGKDGVNAPAALESSPSQDISPMEHDDDCGGHVWYDLGRDVAELHGGWHRRE